MNPLVDLEGEVRHPESLSAGAQSGLQRHALHVLRELQDLQDVDGIGCKETRRAGGSGVLILIILTGPAPSFERASLACTEHSSFKLLEEKDKLIVLSDPK